MLFDLDGTIHDSGPLIGRAVDAAFAAVGGVAMDPASHARLVGPPFEMVAAELLAEQGLGAHLLDDFVAAFRARMGTEERAAPHAFPGILDVVHAVAAAGRRVAVVTSKPRPPAEVVLDVLGLRGMLAAVVARELNVHEAKEETMRRAVVELDLDPSDAVMVGDRMYDITSAAVHGIASIGVTWAAHARREELLDAGAQAIATTPAELAALLGVG